MSDDLMRIAQDACKAYIREHGTPMPSAEELFQALMRGLAAEQKWLEAVFVISWQDVLGSREVYAAALDRSVAELTKAEKQTAALNHVMEKLG